MVSSIIISLLISSVAFTVLSISGIRVHITLSITFLSLIVAFLFSYGSELNGETSVENGTVSSVNSVQVRGFFSSDSIILEDGTIQPVPSGMYKPSEIVEIENQIKNNKLYYLTTVKTYNSSFSFGKYSKKKKTEKILSKEELEKVKKREQ